MTTAVLRVREEACTLLTGCPGTRNRTYRAGRSRVRPARASGV